MKITYLTIEEEKTNYCLVSVSQFNKEEKQIGGTEKLIKRVQTLILGQN